MAAKVWSLEKTEHLLRMFHSKEYSTREMARELRVTQRTVYNHLQCLGLATDSLPRRHRAPFKIKLSDKEENEIIQLYQRGAYVTEIALKLNRPIAPVRRVFKELGLTTSNFRSTKPGQRFGSLEVIEPIAPRKTYKGHLEARSRVICDCGREKEVFNHDLRSGNSKSCGCRIQARKAEAPYVRIFSAYRSNAKDRKMVWELSLIQMMHLISLPCAYCKSLTSNVLRGRRSGISTRVKILEYMGIDRVDSSIGYVLGNVLPACKSCNLGKSSQSLKLFSEWVGRFGCGMSEDNILAAATELGRTLRSLQPRT
jgi:transposase